MTKYDFFEVRHGQGYTVTTTKKNGIKFEKTLFVDMTEPVEVWKIVLTNETAKKRRLSVFSYFDWCLGNAADTHREFHKTFIEVWIDKKNGCLYGEKRAPLVPGYISTGMTEKPLRGFHGAFPKPVAYDGDKEAFLGRYGEQHAPGRGGWKMQELRREVGRRGREPSGGCYARAQAIEDHRFHPGFNSNREEAVRIIKKYQTPEWRTVNSTRSRLSGIL